MSNRVITNQQFSDGTTIDGNRIEDALQDVESFLNAVPQDFVRRRFIENQLVSGFTPVPNGPTVRKHPFMSDDNGVANGITNRYRLKGYGVTRTNLNSYYIWSQSVQFDGPVIIDSYNLIMAHDYGVMSIPQAYKMGSTVYPNYQPPNVNDFELHITVDNQFTPDDRTQNNMEIHKHSFDGHAYLLRPYASGAPVPDMQPSMSLNGGGLSGYAVTIPDLNIPIKSFNRVRFAVVIPEYSGGTGLTDWTSTPWSASVWSQTVSVLERNRRV